MSGSGGTPRVPEIARQRPLHGQSSQSIFCVIDKAQYSEAQEEASYLPPKPTPNIRGGPGWWERIGEVLPQRHDLWWSLGEGTPLPLLPNKSF